MKAKWLKAKAKFEGFEIRERALMIGAIVAVTYLIWNMMLLQPIDKKKLVVLAQERNAKQAITGVEAEITVLDNLTKKDPDADIRAELEQLQQKLNELDKGLSTMAVGLVKAKDLPVILHEMLSQTQSLQLLSLKTLPVTVIDLKAVVDKDASSEQKKSDSAASVTTEAQTQTANLYKHAVEVQFEGTYAATYEFIQSLEKSRSNFYWETLDYRVSDYPKAIMTMRVFTLASDKGVFDQELSLQ
jgi:MSHA biogenesis protein MshJ